MLKRVMSNFVLKKIHTMDSKLKTLSYQINEANKQIESMRNVRGGYFMMKAPSSNSTLMKLVQERDEMVAFQEKLEQKRCKFLSFV